MIEEKLSVEEIKEYGIVSGIVCEGFNGRLTTPWLECVDLTEFLVEFTRLIETHHSK